MHDQTLSPTEKAKKKYRFGFSSFKTQTEKPKQIEDHYIYNADDALIGYMKIEQGNMPNKIKVNGVWYEKTDKVKWSE